MRNSKTKLMAKTAVLTALALALSAFENMLPVPVFAVPGIRLGLANIVTMFALFGYGFPVAATVVLLRTLLAAALFGNPISFFFSFSGGFLALLGMTLLKKMGEKQFSVYGISVAGAALHNVGQICAAAVATGSTAVFSYLGVILLTSYLTGIITGFLYSALNKRLVNYI